MQEEKDDALLLISGSKGSKEADKEYAKKISGAVISCIAKYKVAKLRCVGAASSNNAIKGITIAKNYLLKSEEPKCILVSPSFTMVKFGDEEKTAIMIEAVQMDYEKDGPTCQCVSPSSFGHTGFTGTLAWADPETGIIYIFLSNKIHPDQDNPRLVDMNVRTHIQQVIHDAILY